MNLQNIFSEIEKVDADVYEKLDTRRSAMKQFANISGKVALAAMPFALGSMFKKAYGQTNTDVIATLQFALTLEYLEAEFYTLGVGRAGVMTGTTGDSASLSALQKIRDHENTHVSYLQNVIRSVGATPVAKPTFDFTGGDGSNMGPFRGWDTNYDLFLAIAQTFEDTGVRAYKGSAGSLINNKPILTAALNIHSVEARHASKIRLMRRARKATTAGTASGLYTSNDIKPWIVLNQTNINNAAVQPNYNGEEIIVQNNLNIATIGSVTAEAASASFDEPLSQATVNDLIKIFIV